jgi:hypothetical protein
MDKPVTDVCVFCGTEGVMTKEHLISDWIARKKIIARTGKSIHQVRMGRGAFHNGFFTARARTFYLKA